MPPVHALAPPGHTLSEHVAELVGDHGHWKPTKVAWGRPLIGYESVLPSRRGFALVECALLCPSASSSGFMCRHSVVTAKPWRALRAPLPDMLEDGWVSHVLESPAPLSSRAQA